MELISKKNSLFSGFCNWLKSFLWKSARSIHLDGEEEESAIHIYDLDSSLKEQLFKFYVEGNPLNLVDRDELFIKAAQFIVFSQSCSISAIQREFSVGLSHAKLILDQIESAGIISPFRSDEGRKVLIKDKDSLKELISSLPHFGIADRLDEIDAFYEKYKEEIENQRKEHDILQLEEMKKTEAELLKLMKLEKILKKRLPETIGTGKAIG
jgi:hypothetical protein